ncbi:MAG TPA: enoyl-CoA hydratase-related protein [Acidobacteriaceae bacterium]|nr:enoyl-CoA hydratase-related protein [Acidobacteriaceae bacterium]
MSPEPALRIERRPKLFSVTFDRAAERNTLTQQTLNELSRAFDEAERDPECRIILLQGSSGYFCSGMDFTEMSGRIDSGLENASDVHYMDILRRMSSIGQIIISAVDGQVMAGGIGIVAASDLVIATPASRFSLPEALWGLLPACVLPLLIRRIGFQNAYRMTLTTETATAQQARETGLVDELADSLDDAIRRRSQRLTRLDPETVQRMKAYFSKMWYLSDAMFETAVDEIETLVRQPRVQQNIRNFVEHKKFPWEKI